MTRRPSDRIVYRPPTADMPPRTQLLCLVQFAADAIANRTERDNAIVQARLDWDDDGEPLNPLAEEQTTYAERLAPMRELFNPHLIVLVCHHLLDN